MNSEHLRNILSNVKSGDITIEEALGHLKAFPYEDLGFAKPDHQRALRQGFPEVILGEGKTPEQIVSIAQRLASQSDQLLITRASPEIYKHVKEILPEVEYHTDARAIVLNRVKNIALRPGIMVVCGGTADLPVAEEAVVTAELMGNKVEKAYDIGVAGLHRLLDQLPRLRQSRVVVAVAGMEGALPSVISGLVSIPVIAVPTSVGYGANLGGLAPLLAMLNSCAAGVSVVNINNGFGAGYVAALINGRQSQP
ncbi:MAG: nickel pincer cofactor biosynthesis protein LarB [Dehalococcoidia bacterium]|nr:nickel pincer cofactor biosynthesis protein LarB [Dehalococcoidia bacterium]